MSPLLTVTVIGLLAGTLGTAGGGMLAVLLPHPGRRFIGITIGFAAGIMIAVLALELIPEAIETAGALYGIIGLISGTIIIILLDQFIPHTHAFAGNNKSARFVRASIVIGLGIALHNLPEGLAIGAGYIHEAGVGLAVAIAIAIHNIPEGLAMALPMKAAQLSSIKIIGATFLAGTPMAVGAFIGGVLGGVSPIVLSISLGFAAGAMLFVTCDELIPSANELAPNHQAAISITAGLISGLIILIAVHA